MSERSYPSFVLCCRCSAGEDVMLARGWHQLMTPRGTLDICPECVKRVLAYLRETPPSPPEDWSVRWPGGD